MKTCTKCGIEKVLSEYYKRHKRPSIMAQCKTCTKAEVLKRQQANPERHRIHDNAYAQRNKEKISLGRKRSKALRKEQIAVYNRKYRALNRERRAAYTKFWRRLNPEAAVAALHRRRVRTQGHFTAEQFIDMKTAYQRTCLCCGKREPEISLTADHVVPISLGGGNTIDNIQPLCGSCNSAKHTKTIDYRIA